jgi:glutathione synthase/RimK-type ligase-like ATP-grasp enzyme
MRVLFSRLELRKTLKQTVVVYSNYFDPHADVIINLIGGRASVYRLNTNDFPTGSKFSVWTGGTKRRSSIELSGTSRRLESEDVKSVWVRRPERYNFPGPLLGTDMIYAEREADESLRALMESWNCRWVNQIDANQISAHKATQLSTINELGFSLPSTLITNDPLEALEFLQSLKHGVLCKLMRSPMYEAKGSQRTRLPPKGPLTEDQIAEIPLISQFPVMLQEYIPKLVELRVTVIGEHVFVAEIRSQESLEGQHDWRQDRNVEIRDGSYWDVASQCFNIVKKFGLLYGAIDLIVTPEKEIVFLEINPSGQFLFVEQNIPEFRMANSMVDLLLK